MNLEESMAEYMGGVQMEESGGRNDIITLKFQNKRNV